MLGPPEFFVPAHEFNAMTYEWIPDSCPELAKMVEALGKDGQESTKIYRIVAEERYTSGMP